ncbi:MAG TPA: acetate--CoA ligase family protein [Streptosporangiaceae bacterium]|nr:acetate--CoA ligase family protein [Streptosporangiaceae bacterium]
MTTDIHSQQPAQPHHPTERSALLAMLEARRVAIVGASKREGSFGERMLAEARKSSARPVIYPVNPRYTEINGLPCYPSLTDLPKPADLVLLGVPDAAVEEQLALAASCGARAGVIFGNAHEDPGTARAAEPRPSLRQRLAAIATSAGMELCGAGCMGFANVSHGLRAMGYVEPDPLPAGPVALVTHSGSVFSTMLRSRRAFGFTLAVSSGQELVTAAPSYLSYALDVPDTKVIGLILEAMRQPAELRKVLARAAERDVPVVLLTAGGSESGRAMVAAHSGALAGSDGGWEALVRHYGVHRVSDLAEMADALELFALRVTRRGWRAPGALRAGHGIATVHDSGLERAHTADVADEVGVPFAAISDTTKAKLEELLDPGLLATNPLDVWGTGAETRELFAGSLTALAEDESVDAVALAVDLITELDGDTAYQLAVLDTASETDKPVVVLSNLPGAIDPQTAVLLRSSGIPVLEGLRSGLRALRHLLEHASRPVWREPVSPTLDQGRRDRARRLLSLSRETGEAQLALLREYGIPAVRAERVIDADQALAAAARIGYPVVIKTDQPGIAHKSDAGGVILGIGFPGDVTAAYADLTARLGPAALVCESVPPGVELALGLVSDPDLGPLIVLGAGGTLVELIADRVVALPPLSDEQAAGLLAELKIAPLLAGARGAAAADAAAVTRAITGLAELAYELGQDIEALDINPLICGPDGATAVDALVIGRQSGRSLE